MKYRTERSVTLALRQLLLPVWVIALVLAASPFQTSRAQEAFQYKQTRPILGMPEVRGVLPAGSTNFMPAVYQEGAGGWVIVADSFPAHRAAKQTAITPELEWERSTPSAITT